MKQIRRSNGRFQSAAAFTLGATAGSLVTLLYAPASGQVTRRRIAQRVRQLQRNTARRLGRTGRLLASRAENVRDAATEWISEHVPHTNGRASSIRRPVRHAAHAH